MITPDLSDTIAILGAGPGGLMLARLLELHSINYIVYEKAPDANAIATEGTLDIHAEDGQVALKEAGLLEQFKALAVYEAQAGKFVDEHLNMIWDNPYEGQTDRPEIDRPLLRRLLLESIPAEKIRWKHRVQSVDKETNAVITISFSDGTKQLGFRLVVGADGAWSKARKLVTEVVPKYSGYTYLQSAISPSNPEYAKIAAFAGVGMYSAFGERRGIICQRMSTGLYHIYICLPLPEDWVETHTEELHSDNFRRHLLDTHFANWHPQLKSLISTSDTAFRPWPLHCLPKTALPWTHLKGLTLIGDAAHLSMPNGEGANLALFDSYKLAQAIIAAGSGDIDDAVKEYEQGACERGLVSIEEGHHFLNMFFAEDVAKKFKEWLTVMMAGAKQ